jgi:hypothetical protein
MGLKKKAVRSGIVQSAIYWEFMDRSVSWVTARQEDPCTSRRMNDLYAKLNKGGP